VDFLLQPAISFIGFWHVLLFATMRKNRQPPGNVLTISLLCGQSEANVRP
jgi:hypothetical protein